MHGHNDAAPAPYQAMSRPCYSAINNHATRGRPALVFVPTRKHARLVALGKLGDGQGCLTLD